MKIPLYSQSLLKITSSELYILNFIDGFILLFPEHKFGIQNNMWFFIYVYLENTEQFAIKCIHAPIYP
jgi:hypothetical protein